MGFFILVAGAVVGYLNLRELQRQTTTLGQQVYAGDRAYLLVRNVRIQTAGPLVVGSQLRLQWEAVNVGRTPAHNLRTTYAIFFGPPASEPPPGTVRGYSEARVLGPGDIEESPDVYGVWLDNNAGRTLTVDDLERLKRGDVLNARIVVNYDTVFRDVSGRTTVCAYYEGSRFSYCGLRGTQVQ